MTFEMAEARVKELASQPGWSMRMDRSNFAPDMCFVFIDGERGFGRTWEAAFKDYHVRAADRRDGKCPRCHKPLEAVCSES